MTEEKRKPTPEEVRAAADATRCDLMTWLPAARERMGARLNHLATPTLTLGRDEQLWEQGVPATLGWTVPPKGPGISRGKSRSLSANPTGDH